MIHFNRIEIFESVDVDKTNESKDCHIYNCVKEKVDHYKDHLLKTKKD